MSSEEVVSEKKKSNVIDENQTFYPPLFVLLNKPFEDFDRTPTVLQSSQILDL